MQEVEAKFLATPGKPPEEVLRRLQESLAWAGFRIQPKGRRSFTDRYFDTVDHQLRTAGWSYRERDDKQGRRIALQEIARARNAVFDREQAEQPIARDQDLRHPGPGSVGDRLSNLLHPDAELQLLFTVTSDRAAYSLSHPDHPRGLIEMAFDDGQIEAREPVDFKELALELKEGPHELLSTILAAVELEPALIDARLSTLERGLIAAGCPLERRQWPRPPAMSRNSRWVDVAAARLKAEYNQLRLYEPYAWEGVHAEGVQQMWAAVRRIRAALSAFAPVLPAHPMNDLTSPLRRLTSALGAVRNVDRELAHVARYRERQKPADQPSLDRYHAHLRQLRQERHRALIRTLDDEGHAALLAELRTLLRVAAEPGRGPSLKVGDVAPAVVAPLLERVIRRGRALDSETPDQHLHRLGVDVDRLGYRLQFLQGAYDGSLAPAIDALRGLEQRLGAHADACAARDHLTRYRTLQADPWERSLWKSLALLEKKRSREQRAALAEDWQRFEAAAAELPERL